MTITTGYTPNLSDPKYSARIFKRMKQAAGWSKSLLDNEPREVSKRVIDKQFGQATNELSVWLRSKLLNCVDHKYHFGDDPKCKSYVLDVAGYEEVRAVLQGGEATPAELPSMTSTTDAVIYDQDLVYYWFWNAHKDELESGQFNYESKESARLWHGAQNLRKTYKSQVWSRAGYAHDYDIRACAPNLIVQTAMHLGLECLDDETEQFLRDPTSLRVHLCNLAGISLKQAKALLNALFCGAKLGCSGEFALFALIDNDHAAMRLLQADTRLDKLRLDIKACWALIEPQYLGVRRNEMGRKIALNSKRKWAFYFQQERRVLDAVANYLKARDNKHFLEHDGFRTANPVSTDELVTHIRAITGFKLELA